MKPLVLVLLFLSGILANVYAAGQAPSPKTSPDTTKPAVTTTTVAHAAPVAAGGGTQALIIADSSKAEAAASTCLPPSPHRDWVGWILIVLIIVLFIGVAWKSNLLRDPIANPVAFMLAAQLTKYANITNINKIPKPFSLARTQLGVWTVIVSCTYVYLGLIRNFSLQDIAVDSTILLLMGISAGTTAAGSVIDSTASPDQQGVQYPSDNFFADILSDQNGINIHRFQNVIWTIIAMTLFVAKVRYCGCGELPTLDSTLIALTGISSATYLGLKINENTPPAIPPAAPPAPAAAVQGQQP